MTLGFLQPEGLLEPEPLAIRPVQLLARVLVEPHERAMEIPGDWQSPDFSFAGAL